ncbi:ADP-heptose--LPS heptosyltransferase 2 [bacterium BMS3Bbin11]|nr:ADP-heptose--LPS heptosyltransferase 2 [bacterium BMS3Abin11]GBE46210.1 ADP-heptose--LPS heptosyltransferase 2 [bacterium BMS3Bbin11]GMT39681.1 MAG: lipopolysaccharide heptosyltransferase II [bacterium]HDH08419.1 lipopolysaccharide heptosyltransferase II [Gammaproteobacteria bacterium]HDH15555.1 lipopolysaccharide heptosyltransferase II [Gammaproteobacteria bacterium]
MSTPYRILVIGPSWIGDMMMAQSLFMLLKQNNPDCCIDVLAPGWSLPLLVHMPEVSEAIRSPFQHGEAGLRQRYLLGKSLRGRHYDQAVILPNSMKSALVPYWARIPLRTGFVGEMRYGLVNDARKLNTDTLPKTVMRFTSLGLPARQTLPENIPLPRLATNELDISASLDTLNLADTHTPVLALCPGAEFGPAKQWPARHLATLANDRLDQGWRVWLLGSDKDVDICASITSSTNDRCKNLAGKTELGQVIDLMSRATAIVSNDSGLMHIAAALDKPLVAIYGSSDPDFTPPLSNKVEILSLRLSCSPCFKRKCPLGHLDCLNKLEPERVGNAIDLLLEKESND